MAGFAAPATVVRDHGVVVVALPRVEWIAWLIARDGAIAGPTGDPRLELVERAGSGDPQAFETLIRARGDRLLGLARKILRDQDAADDALQQAIVAAWRTLPRLRDPGAFDTWLTRLVVNACYGEANRTRRFRAQVRQVVEEPVAADRVDAIDDREALDQAFRALTPAHRAVVVLHHYADLPLTEVARIVGVGPATARTRLHYALRALRAALEAQERPVIEELSS
jgi:RNA polymerase sigma-70 factor (ECF subfamily)